MTETIQKFRYDTFSSNFTNIEISDDLKRAILTIPLMHGGPNKKGLYWTAEMLEEIAPMFRKTAFRYDIDGKEGSSHVVNKLSSPHFDVGWTYSGEDGAWYDKDSKTLWVKGEVTHPAVVEKLSRKTTDGQREVNFASMGIIIDKAVCSICGSNYDDFCENGHQRMQVADGQVCYKVPTKARKSLHVALTNDPADGEAEIANCIIQELGETQMSPNDIKDQASNQIASTNDSQIPGGLAPSSPQTGQPGIAPSPQDILRDLAERVKTLETQVSEKAMQEGTPELVNAAPQDQKMQDNMGNTEQFDALEAKKMEENTGQTTQEKVPVNPEARKTETQDNGEGMMEIKALLQEILNRLPAPMETQDLNDLANADKSKIKHDETKPDEHEAPGDAVSKEAATDESNVKNKKHMAEPGMVATQDTSDEAKGLKAEVADMKNAMREMAKRLEIQDTSIPEFGGSMSSDSSSPELADMSANERKEKFGAYGAFDAIFNGTDSAKRFGGK